MTAKLVEIKNPPSETINLDRRNNVVMILTKDNVGRLKSTLQQYQDLPYDCFLIDDSTRVLTRDYVKRHSHNVVYHDEEEQRKFLQRINIPNLGRFTRELGLPGHTLGYCRNYAVVLASALGYRQLLMIDDDIMFHDIRQIGGTFEALNNHEIVGATTVGMADDSIIGYFARRAGTPQYDYITGQYAGFDLQKLEYFFPNVYNEDLILYSLQGSGRKFGRVGQVSHLKSDQMRDMDERVPYQEEGETLLEGFSKATVLGEPDVLEDEKFWKAILIERDMEIGELRSRVGSEDVALFDRIDKLRRAHKSRLTARHFAEFSREYYSNLRIWRETLSLSRLVGQNAQIGTNR